MGGRASEPPFRTQCCASMWSRDPRTPEIREWLATLEPAEELAALIALRTVSEYARRDRRWKRRIAELERQLDLKGAELVRLDATVRRMVKAMSAFA